MDALLVMIGNWRTTLLGLLSAVVIYEAGIGNKLPATKQDWWMFALGVLALALGLASKDARTGSRPLIVLLMIGLLAGCDPADDVAKFTRADVQQALTLATAATDPGAPYRARCYTTLLKYLPEGSTLGQLVPDIKGVASAYEAAAELDAKVSGGASVVPPELEADCAYIKDQLRKFALRNAAKFAPVPGAAAVGGLLR